MRPIDHIGRGSGTGRETPPSPRLIESAREFESQLMKELLRPLTCPDEDEAQSGFAGALADFAASDLGRALSDRGGFGIAERILHSLSGSGTQSGQNPAAGKTDADGCSGLK